MAEKPQQVQERFECVGLSVHFLYSFALAKKLAASEFEPFDASELVQRGQLGFKAGTPDQRRGIKQHLDLIEDIAFKNLEPFRAEIASNPACSGTSGSVGLCEVQIEPLLRIFRTGATCSYKVSLLQCGDLPIPLKRVHAVLGLVQQIEDRRTPSLLRLPSRPNAVTLHSLFLECVRDLIKECGTDQGEIVWLDEAKGYLGGLKNGEENESQSPWVTTVAQVRGETAAAFCDTWAEHQHPAAEKALHISPFEAEVAGILFRSVHGSNFELEPGYGESRVQGGSAALHNLNLDARLHVTVCNRSILCIHPHNPEKSPRPEDYFIPDLLDLSGVLRARWHILTVMNLCLDKVLIELKNESASAEQKMRMVINARSWLARLLEDPELYRVAGDALADISLRLKHVFREDALRKLLLEKAELIERIRAGVSELAWLSLESRYK